MTKEMPVASEEKMGEPDASSSEERSSPDAQEVVAVHCTIVLPTGMSVILGDVSITEDVAHIRSALFELVEAASYTCYTLVDRTTGKEWQDYTEIASCIPSADELVKGQVKEGVLKVQLRMVEGKYDVRKVRQHAKRLRDILENPPTHTTSAFVDACANIEPLIAKPVPCSAAAGKSWDKGLSNFYESALYNLCPPPVLLECGTEFPNGRPALLAKSKEGTGGIVEAGTALRAALQDVSLSGYNPPPPHRTLVGDLAYFEVRALDSSDALTSFHVTATSKGFYVNRSSRTVFDARPAEFPHFSSLLLNTILSRAGVVRKIYSSYLRAVVSCVTPKEERDDKESNDVTGQALGLIAFQHRLGRGERVSLQKQWLALPKNEVLNGASLGVTNSAAHTWDVSRTQEDLADAMGNEDHTAPPREWNEHFQAFSDVQVPSDIADAAQALWKYRSISQLEVEFKECCKRAAVAVLAGVLPPINPHDSKESHVYFYNNMYFSLALDDPLKLTKGDDALRKIIKADLMNQAILRDMGVEGLRAVPTACVDYLGHRVLCQTPIPGIHSTTGPAMATLQYGSLDLGTELACKEETRAMMEAFGEKFGLRQVMLKKCPWTEEHRAKAEEERQMRLEMAVNDPFSSSSEEGGENSIKVTKEGETEPTIGEDGEAYVPHVGPLESKIILGTDKRSYVLELMRLQPRDPNFVLAAQGGTGKLSDEEITQVGEQRELPMTYVLRQELKVAFTTERKRRIREQMMRKSRELATEIQKRHTAEQEAKKAKDMPAEGEDGDDKKKEEDEESKEFKLSDCEEALQAEFKEKHECIKKDAEEEIEGFEKRFEKININVFLPENAMMSATEKTQDEALVREMGTFLYDDLLPMIIERTRGDDVSLFDGESLTQLLHGVGVNMRYCGRLASLAREGEKNDAELKEKGLIRRNPMPTSVLELLEMEMLARCVKHMTNDSMRGVAGSFGDGHIRSPAHIMVSVLNMIFSTTAECQFTSEVDGLSTTRSGGKSSGKRSKKSDRVTGDAVDALVAFGVASVSNRVPSTAHATVSRDTFFTALATQLKKRFNYDIDVIFCKGSRGGRDASGLSSRLHGIPLLRRICQQCCITLVNRDYDLTSTEPFTIGDVVEIFPRVTHSSDMQRPAFPQLEGLMGLARQLHSIGNFRSAFQAAQQAYAWAQHVHGQVHPVVFEATSQLLALLIDVKDWPKALALAAQLLSSKMQLYGLDNHRVMQGHQQIAAIAVGAADVEEDSVKKTAYYATAVKHLEAALYIISVISPSDAPFCFDLKLSLAAAYTGVGRNDESFKLYKELHETENKRTHEHPENKLVIMTNLAFAYEGASERAAGNPATATAAADHMSSAVALYRESILRTRMLNGNQETEHVVRMNDRLKAMRRKEVEMNVKKAQQDKKDEASRAESENLNWLSGESAASKKKQTSNQNSKKKKKKSK